MNDKEKSVKLMRICGWMVHEGDSLYDMSLVNDNHEHLLSMPSHYYDGELPNLYDPANMALAWRVCGWAYKHTLYEGGPPIGEAFHDWWFDDYEAPDPGDPEAQRLWLDKILELATEAGMVE